MSRFECNGVLSFITHEQKEILNARFAESNAKVMPHELSGPLSISYSQAISVLTALQALGFAQNYIVVYHSCEPDLPISYTKFEDGFPALPWVCENCQEEVENFEELSFGIMAISNRQIHFI